MTEPERIGVFYSQSSHFETALRRLRAQYPATHITACVPALYPFASEIRPLVDDVTETERPHYSLGDPVACWRLVHTLRSGRYDLFAVLFDTARLRILSALSGASQCAILPVDGPVVSFSPSIVKTLAGEAAARARGIIAFTRVWLAVHLLRVHLRK